MPSGQANIQNNTIANNTIGIQLPSPYSTIINNNFLNNQLSISLIDTYANILQSNNINATYNYWGTNDQQAINQTNFDFKNNFNLGTVNFVPFLNTPNSQTPALPTSTPTPTPTATQTATTAPSTTPTPTPSVPEVSYLAILPLLLSLFFVGVVLRHRKITNNA